MASGREIDHCTHMAVHTRKILQSKIGRFSASLGVSLAYKMSEIILKFYTAEKFRNTVLISLLVRL